MPDSNDKSSILADNRYGFHSAPIVDDKAGVPPEFAHTKVLVPVQGLLQKTERAQSLKPDDENYRLAVTLLRNCCAELVAPLEYNKPGAVTHDTKDSVEEPATKNYRSSTF